LLELARKDQGVEPLPDRDDALRSRCQRSRQSVAPGLSSYVLGIAQQAS